MRGQLTVEQLRSILADLPGEMRVYGLDDQGWFAIRSWQIDDSSPDPGLYLDQGL